MLDPGYGMGVSFGDYNNDGLLDLHVTNMSSTAGNRILSRLYPDSSPQNNVLRKLAAGNNLYKNIGGGRYQDVTAEVGGFQGGWAWGGGFLDVDNDGLGRHLHTEWIRLWQVHEGHLKPVLASGGDANQRSSSGSGRTSGRPESSPPRTKDFLLAGMSAIRSI